MKFKQLLAGAALGAMVLASPQVMAQKKKSEPKPILTGNVAVTSEYMFRGIPQEAGAALQAGVDWTHSLGIYAGAWFSNAAASGGNEADVYAGYGIRLGQFNLEGGVIYYAFTEDTNTGAAVCNTGATGVGVACNADYAEVYVGGAFGPASLKVFYAPEYGFDAGNDELMYVTTSVNLTLTDTISIIPQVGFTAGDGAKAAFGDEYMDYSVTAIKSLGEGLSVSLGVVGADLDNSGTGGFQSHPKFVVGVKKNFKVL